MIFPAKAASVTYGSKYSRMDQVKFFKTVFKKS